MLNAPDTAVGKVAGPVTLSTTLSPAATEAVEPVLLQEVPPLAMLHDSAESDWFTRTVNVVVLPAALAFHAT